MSFFFRAPSNPLPALPWRNTIICSAAMTWVLGGISESPKVCLNRCCWGFSLSSPGPFFLYWHQHRGTNCLAVARIRLLVCQMAASQGRHPTITQCKKRSSLENICINSLWGERAGLTAALTQMKVITQRAQEDLTKKKNKTSNSFIFSRRGGTDLRYIDNTVQKSKSATTFDLRQIQHVKCPFRTW